LGFDFLELSEFLGDNFVGVGISFEVTGGPILSTSKLFEDFVFELLLCLRPLSWMDFLESAEMNVTIVAASDFSEGSKSTEVI